MLGVIRAGVMQKLSEYYSAFLAGSGASLMEEFNIPAEHSMVSKDDANERRWGGGRKGSACVVEVEGWGKLIGKVQYLSSNNNTAPLSCCIEFFISKRSHYAPPTLFSV